MEAHVILLTVVQLTGEDETFMVMESCIAQKKMFIDRT